MPKLFENAFHYAAIGMALVDLDGRFLRVNRSLCQLVGYSEAELLATHFQEITHPDDIDSDLAHVGQMLRGEIESYQMEKRYRHKDGNFVWVLLSVSLARDEAENRRCFISQIEDITMRKTAEARIIADALEKQRLYDELRRATAEIRSLQEGLVTVCAWTKQVRDGKNWEPLETFLRRLGLKVSHGMSDEAAGQMLNELNRPDQS